MRPATAEQTADRLSIFAAGVLRRSRHSDRRQPILTPPTKPVSHGGDLAAATARFGEPREGWLDLSTGINPCPYPLPPLSESTWTRLPQRDRAAALLAAARRCYRVAPAAGLVAGPGTQAIIQWLPRLLPATRICVHGPTYGEHAAAWRDAGHAVAPDVEAAAAVEVFVNPNNPDGCVWPRDALLAAAARCAAAGGFAVVDEAFADLDPEAGLGPSSGTDGLMVLRSFGKFFGLAGLRIGFAFGDSTQIERLGRAMGPWAVSGPALEVAEAALSDTAWIEETRARLRSLRQRLDGVLGDAGLEILGGTDLFRLIRCDDAASLHAHLGARGILTRIFGDEPGWIRFGLPGDDTAFARLTQALASLRTG
jgi:cobalamin biosynthetic protein CobC